MEQVGAVLDEAIKETIGIVVQEVGARPRRPRRRGDRRASGCSAGSIRPSRRPHPADARDDLTITRARDERPDRRRPGAVMERNPIRGVGGWLRSVAPERQHPEDRRRGRPAGRHRQRPRRDGGQRAGRRQPDPRALRQLRRAGRRRPQRQHQADGDHDHERRRARRRVGGGERSSPEDRPGALFLLTLIAGAAMIAAGLLRLGRFTRFVSHSVMIGFLSGVAVNIIAGQIPDLTGAEAEGSVAVQKAWDVLTHPSRDRSGVAPHRRRRVRHHRRARPHPHRRLRRRRRPGRPDDRRGPRPVPTSPRSRTRATSPEGIPLPGLARAVDVLVVAARRRAGGRRDRARAGRRRRRVRPQRRTAPAPTPTSTSSPKASATSAPGSSRASRSAVRSARPPSTGPPGPAPAGRRSSPVCGCC